MFLFRPLARTETAFLRKVLVLPDSIALQLGRNTDKLFNVYRKNKNLVNYTASSCHKEMSLFKKNVSIPGIYKNLSFQIYVTYAIL